MPNNSVILVRMPLLRWCGVPSGRGFLAPLLDRNWGGRAAAHIRLPACRGLALRVGDAPLVGEGDALLDSSLSRRTLDFVDCRDRGRASKTAAADLPTHR
jgi:hypothetical protein